MNAMTRRRRTSALLWSWSLQTAVVLALFAAGWQIFCADGLGSIFAPLGLKAALLVFAASSAHWMLCGWIKVAEGPFLYAEYGGVENRLRRIRFRDRPDWELREPLPVRLEFDLKPSCLVQVSVWENFLGRNRIMWSAVDMYTGRNVFPDEPDHDV